MIFVFECSFCPPVWPCPAATRMATPGRAKAVPPPAPQTSIARGAPVGLQVKIRKLGGRERVHVPLDRFTLQVVMLHTLCAHEF